MVMIDTNYASEPQDVGAVSDSELSDELDKRRMKAGVAADAWMSVGQAWRSTDVSDTSIYVCV